MVGREIELDAFVIPDGHRVYKLFPGASYRLSKAVSEADFAFLDIRGLDALESHPEGWDEANVLEIITRDRITRADTSPRQRPGKRRESAIASDKKKLGYLKLLYLVAQKGDLLMVPLSAGAGGDVAIGEFVEDPGIVHRANIRDGDDIFSTWVRRIRWHVRRTSKSRFSSTLNLGMHSQTAMHALARSLREEVYLAYYRSFTYEGIYVATFPTQKERFNTTDQATIGIWFNSLAVIHDRLKANQAIPVAEDLLMLGLEHSSVDLELQRNSPISAIVRTFGPLAFALATMYPMAVDGATLDDYKHVTISVKPVGTATDACKVIIAADVADIAMGLGHGRFDTHCKLTVRIDKETTMHSSGHLKKVRKRPS